ncbi:MAG: triacylglycerol lipase [Oscillospiraceae bacterium]|nr:triacylglycerol lipase [Oscillospiraceae bacterium]
MRLRVCRHGVVCLRAFLISAAVSLAYHIVLAFRLFPESWSLWLWSAIICISVEAILFWNGMISVYCASVQLGIRHRVIGIVCGCIPILHLFMLRRIIRTVSTEVDFETEKDRLNAARAGSRVCATRYPILLVHGVFFRDFRFLNYWGRIPAELERNGAKIYYGNQPSAASVNDCGIEIAERIRSIVSDTGCGKVNIIAHSKGGLDCRRAAELIGPEYIASITTINTPHRGCEFADYLLNKMPDALVDKIAGAYNSALKGFGEEADFISAVRDLTAESCRARGDSEIEGIYCQSVGSELKKATSGKFPLSFTYNLVKYFDGPNDGLVSASSLRWGEHTFLPSPGRRGISHGDMVDLNRENIEGFDVREFYVELVNGLKKRGL